MNAAYDFDVINTDVILNRMEISEGKLMLPDGMNYRLLVLPNIKDIPDEVVKKVEKMLAAGANVLIQNPEIAQKINGNVLQNMTIDDALTKLAIEKDFTHDEKKLDFIHRKVGDLDMYFVRNKTDQPISETCAFRITNKQAEFWDPVTAQQYNITNAKGTNDKTAINLHLAPYGSCFIVFSDESRELPEYDIPTETRSTEIKGPWTLSFPENWGAPSSVELEELISWTDHEHKGINYFSGTASYSNSFNISKVALDKSKVINIDLGEVLDVAEVFVNGEPVGVLWTKPFKLNIKDYVKEGGNSIEIRITNMWINRLTGDMDLPVEEKFCRTNRPYILEAYSEIGDETFRVQRSGLIGPLRVEEVLTKE